jgi:hypothetical protein
MLTTGRGLQQSGLLKKSKGFIGVGGETWTGVKGELEEPCSGRFKYTGCNRCGRGNLFDSSSIFILILAENTAGAVHFTFQ